jgi:RNA polymerase sigma-70 factor, ECF subfamily
LPDYEERDEHLVQAAGKGDFKAFEKIVARHQAWAWQVAWRFTGDRDQAADIVQDAFLRLLNAAGRYRPTAQFTTYFYKILSRLCLDRARKKQPLFMDTLPDRPDPLPGAADKVMAKETAAMVRSALDALAPNQRMAIVLKYYENLNYREIAAILNISPKAVERLLARARERLRNLLGNQLHFFS